MEKHVGTELTTEGARSTQKPKDNGTGIKKKCWHNMIPACESASQAVEESDARGSKKGGPGGQIRPPGGRSPLRPVSGPLSPPGGAPERLREVIFADMLGVIVGSIWDAQAEKLKIVIFKCCFCLFGSFLYCLPCCVAGGAAHMQKSRKSIGFLSVASHMRLFLAAPEAIKFQRIRVANID